MRFANTRKELLSLQSFASSPTRPCSTHGALSPTKFVLSLQEERLNGVIIILS